MQLVAYLKNERLDATEIPHEPWRALAKRSDYKYLVFLECGQRARRVTRLGRQFFAHLRAANCSVAHKSESAQHLTMKLALKDQINAYPGWRAEVEYVGPDRQWIADVMAFHENGRRLAFEVQLSAQTEEEYFDRSQRYFDARIGPIWVLPQQLYWRELKLPVIFSGFGKSSELPEMPGDLMDCQEYQPMYLKVVSVGACVNEVLDPAFNWTFGSPEQQRRRRLEEAEAARVRAVAVAASDLARQEDALRKANIELKVKQQRELLAAEKIADFVRVASPAEAVASGPSIIAGVPTWACVVTCPESHPVLIWRLTNPAKVGPKEQQWRPERENFRNIHRHVDDWLKTVNVPVTKGKLVPIKGPGKRAAFACASCGDLIQPRDIRALPPEKWSIIAGAEGPDVRYVPSARVLHAWESLRVQPAAKQRKDQDREPSKRTAAQEPLLEDSSHFIGPQRKPLWIFEARSDQEMVARQAAKHERAAQLQAVRDNPRYRVEPNGFRFGCTDCGGIFGDADEGIHANARCTSLSN